MEEEEEKITARLRKLGSTWTTYFTMFLFFLTHWVTYGSHLKNNTEFVHHFSLYVFSKAYIRWLIDAKVKPKHYYLSKPDWLLTEETAVKTTSNKKLQLLEGIA